MPTITAARYEVFVWWVKDRTAATSVPFTIVHAQGSSIVTTDQTQAGGEWSSLGVYEFNAIAGEYIEVDDSNGKTIADAVRWVEVVTGTPQVSTDIYYVHTDQLGTPKTLTDASGTPVWSASYDPFGQATVDADPDGDGSMVTFNVRFPGQYYDSESGLHYNYFRTYDPDTGRYLESDPIGLEAGPNPYIYANDNPLLYIDAVGLNPARVGAYILCEILSDFTDRKRNNYEKAIRNIWQQWIDALHESHQSAVLNCLYKTNECERKRCIDKAAEDARRKEQGYWEEFQKLNRQNPWDLIQCPPLLKPRRPPRRRL